MAYGKPIVYPDFPGFREVLGSDNDGKYRAGDGHDLNRVVRALLSDAGLRKRTGENNRRKFDLISFQAEFEKLSSLYERILMHD